MNDEFGGFQGTGDNQVDRANPIVYTARCMHTLANVINFDYPFSAENYPNVDRYLLRDQHYELVDMQDQFESSPVLRSVYNNFLKAYHSRVANFFWILLSKLSIRNQTHLADLWLRVNVFFKYLVDDVIDNGPINQPEMCGIEGNIRSAIIQHFREYNIAETPHLDSPKIYEVALVNENQEDQRFEIICGQVVSQVRFGNNIRDFNNKFKDNLYSKNIAALKQQNKDLQEKLLEHQQLDEARVNKINQQDDKIKNLENAVEESNQKIGQQQENLLDTQSQVENLKRSLASMFSEVQKWQKETVDNHNYTKHKAEERINAIQVTLKDDTDDIEDGNTQSVPSGLAAGGS